MVYLNFCMNTKLSIKDKSDNSLFMKASAFRKNIRKTEPHKHNSYFEIIYLSAGQGYHSIDNKTYEVHPPVLFFVRKEQVHHWDLAADPEPEGFVVILKKTFFEQSLDGELKSLLLKVSKLSYVYCKESATIHQLLDALTREAAEEVGENEHAFPLQEGLIKGLFAKILQVAEPGQPSRGAESDLFQGFRDLLGTGLFKQHAVAYYAGLLNTTPQNLNAVCRKAVNQSAADVLAESIVEEAKRLLLYTDQRISEIAFSLSFKDPSHFVKYFKRHTGDTPQAFRTGQR
jgi:AraC family transcriptional regulator, transcriptional activator of pobA